MLSHYRIFYHLSSVCCQWTFESSPQRPWWTIWTDTLQKHYSIQADIEWLLMAVIVPIFSGIKVSCCSIFSFLCNILWTIVFFFLPLYCCIVSPSNYGFWLLLWYFQAFLGTIWGNFKFLTIFHPILMQCFAKWS